MVWYVMNLLEIFHRIHSLLHRKGEAWKTDSRKWHWNETKYVLLHWQSLNFFLIYFPQEWVQYGMNKDYFLHLTRKKIFFQIQQILYPWKNYDIWSLQFAQIFKQSTWYQKNWRTNFEPLIATLAHINLLEWTYLKYAIHTHLV